MRKYFYIYDATTGEVYKRGLNRKQKRYFKKLSKKWGYDIKVGVHKD